MKEKPVVGGPIDMEGVTDLGFRELIAASGDVSEFVPYDAAARKRAAHHDAYYVDNDTHTALCLWPSVMGQSIELRDISDGRTEGLHQLVGEKAVGDWSLSWHYFVPAEVFAEGVGNLFVGGRMVMRLWCSLMELCRSTGSDSVKTTLSHIVETMGATPGTRVRSAAASVLRALHFSHFGGRNETTGEMFSMWLIPTLKLPARKGKDEVFFAVNRHFAQVALALGRGENIRELDVQFAAISKRQKMLIRHGKLATWAVGLKSKKGKRRRPFRYSVGRLFTDPKILGLSTGTIDGMKLPVRIKRIKEEADMLAADGWETSWTHDKTKLQKMFDAVEKNIEDEIARREFHLFFPPGIQPALMVLYLSGKTAPAALAKAIPDWTKFRRQARQHFDLSKWVLHFIQEL